MLNTDKWIKYSYMCPDCDSLIEYTCNSIWNFPSGDVRSITCVCGTEALQIGQEDATIQSTNKEKENPMNTITPDIYDDIYNANALITYKVIKDGTTEYKTIKVNELEWAMEDKNRLSNKVNNLQSQVNQIIDNLTEDYWYSDSTDKEEVLTELCEIINHSPKKEICFTATIRFNGRIDVDMADVADFSISDALGDAYVDINNGDVVIDDYDIEDVSEQY